MPDATRRMIAPILSFLVVGALVFLQAVAPLACGDRAPDQRPSVAQAGGGVRLETIGEREQNVAAGMRITSERHRGTSTSVLRDVITTGSACGWETRYSCQLHDGEGSLEQGTNAFLLERGELYIRSSKDGTNAKVNSTPPQIPIVVKKASIQGGSYGTHWWVQAFTRDDGVPVLRFALLDPPSNETLGKIEIWDTSTKERVTLVDKDTFVEILNDSIPERNPPTPISFTPDVEALVNKAKERAGWADLR